MPVWGTVSGKIALHAGLLIATGRIDLDTVRMTLDPSLPVSAVDVPVARKLGVSVDVRTPQDLPRDREIGLGTHAARLRRVVVDPALASGMAVGTDILRLMPVAIDLRGWRMTSGSWRDLPVLTARMHPVHATVTDDHCLAIDATDANGQPLRVALVGKPLGTSPRVAIRLGDVAMAATTGSPTCPSSQAQIDWSSLTGHRIVFDLKDERVWID
ncbi:MAG: hypothetical protein J0I47_04810 [Sphingomonas sp.]|uniref:hypothetical protein n=1 Tax=Sphingomonas sp. TaxID=28214 RepID=UPI001AD3FCCF|nr:hypothetical protein [Sphingomonas sp.]MBN8807545.1 hypothetical protein [Sphingomonas sp.]